MTQFLAYYNLCPVNDTKEFLGLSKDQEDGNIITTLGRNIIMIIRVSSQKQERSWTVSDKLTSKVVYDRKMKQYVGVFANRYIRCWSESTTNINKEKKMKFTKTIADLVSSEDNETVILYSDGSCESLSSGIDSRKTQQPMEQKHLANQSICDAKLFVSSNGQKTLTYFTTDPTTKIVQLVTIRLDDNTLTPLGNKKLFKLDRREQNVDLAGYTVVDGQQDISLMTIWSDKRIFSMPLNEDSSSQNAPGSFISMMNMLNVEQPISILGISKNCVAIYGSNSTQEGSSLLLYNTRFKVVNAKQFFKIYFNFSRLWVVGNHILLAMGQNLSVVTYRVSKELLSEMMGSQISNDFESYVGKDFINEGDELEGILEFNETKSGESRIIADPISYKNVTQPADGRSVPYQPYETFNHNFTRVSSSNTHVNVISSEKQNDFRIDLIGNYNDTNFTTEEIELIGKDLEKCGASEKEISEKILTIVLKAGIISDISACIRRYSNISQKMLAKVLKYALSDVNSVAQAPNKNEATAYLNSDSKLSAPTKIITNEKINLLNLVLSCSIDLETIATHVRKELNFEQALVLIEHLYTIFTRDYVSLEERPETSLEFDEDIQVLRWFNVILNTHFQELALSQNTKLFDILIGWKTELSLYKKDLQDLQSTCASLYSLIEGKCSRDNLHSKWYSIEEVKLF